MRSSDGKTRDLVSSIGGAGWDYSLARHPYFEIERPLGPHYCVYNRREMACCFDESSTVDEYWKLRREAGVLHTGELPLEFRGPDAERLLDKLFTKDIRRLRPGRCGYGLACYEDGGLIVDGVLLRLAEDRFWYAQADGDFYGWARAHATGLDVEIGDPEVFVSQIQGPNSLEILAAASDDGLPDGFTYFAIARVRFAGQEIVVSRTGYTNELGWEFYTEPWHDAEALWRHLEAAGEPFDLAPVGLDAMNIRRIEAGILNAGSDFDATTTPYDVGLGRFVDEHKADFLGKDALANAVRTRRLTGLECAGGEPLTGATLLIDGEPAGKVTAGATSPYLKHGIGIALMDRPGTSAGQTFEVACKDQKFHRGGLVELPFYDKRGEIPRGKRVDVPDIT